MEIYRHKRWDLDSFSKLNQTNLSNYSSTIPTPKHECPKDQWTCQSAENNTPIYFKYWLMRATLYTKQLFKPQKNVY